jgi:hypothetical protein
MRLNEIQALKGKKKMKRYCAATSTAKSSPWLAGMFCVFVVEVVIR